MPSEGIQKKGCETNSRMFDDVRRSRLLFDAELADSIRANVPIERNESDSLNDSTIIRFAKLLDCSHPNSEFQNNILAPAFRAVFHV